MAPAGAESRYTSTTNPRPYVFPGDSFSQKMSSLVIPYSRAPLTYVGREDSWDKTATGMALGLLKKQLPLFRITQSHEGSASLSYTLVFWLCSPGMGGDRAHCVCCWKHWALSQACIPAQEGGRGSSILLMQSAVWTEGSHRHAEISWFLALKETSAVLS